MMSKEWRDGYAKTYTYAWRRLAKSLRYLGLLIVQELRKDFRF